MQYQRIIELRDGRACCLRSAVESDGQAELSCRFCGSHQLFDRRELEELLKIAREKRSEKK